MSKLKIVLVLAMMAISFGVNAQSVGGKQLADMDYPYIEIVGKTKFMSSKLEIRIDYGQEYKQIFATEQQVIDELNNFVSFNNLIDALNFFTKYGYVLDKVYIITYGNVSVFHWVIKKELKN